MEKFQSMNGRLANAGHSVYVIEFNNQGVTNSPDPTDPIGNDLRIAIDLDISGTDMQYIIAYIAVFLIFGVIDLAWLSAMGSILYRPVLGDILLDKLRIAPAVVFYAVFPIGIVFFAVRPALEANSITTAVLCGLLFGAVAYATYDLTNFATLKNWNLQITIIDILYGAFAAAVAAGLSTLIIRHLPLSFGGLSG